MRKRIMDTALVLLATPLVLPLAVVTGALVRLNLGRPVFFRQQRVGLGGRAFELLKFRSMLPEVDADGTPLLDKDRMTPFGRVLRASSLDEIPQLLNVLTGDLSLIGPRPLHVRYLPHYTPTELIRHTVRPGITGAAQVSGRNTLSWEERLTHDVEYARHATHLDDLRILFGTVRQVFSHSDVVLDNWDHFESFDVHRSYPSDGTYALRRVEPRDAPVCTGWWGTGHPAEDIGLPTNPEPEDFLAWVRDIRAQEARRDLALYRVGTGEVVALAGWIGDENTEQPRLYVLVDPGVTEPEVWSAALQLLLTLLIEEEQAQKAVLINPKGPLSSAATELGFRSAADVTAQDQPRLELMWDYSTEHAGGGA